MKLKVCGRYEDTGRYAFLRLPNFKTSPVKIGQLGYNLYLLDYL